jgi:hypothetical protein
MVRVNDVVADLERALHRYLKFEVVERAVLLYLLC